MRPRVLFCISILLLFWIGSFAQPVINIKDENPIRYFGKDVFIYQDSSKLLTFEELSNRSDLFTRSTTMVPNFGINNSNNWIKFTLHNQSEVKDLILNVSNSIIDQVTLYKMSNGAVDSLTFNFADSLYRRSFEHQFYTFDIEISKGESATCYLKLVSTKQLLVPMTVSVEKRVVHDLLILDLQSGIYIGIMVAMLLYNLFLFFSARDKHYWVYVHYIFWVAIAQLAVLGYFPRFFNWSFLSSLNFVTFAGAMSGIASIIFVKSFLNTQKYGARLNIWLHGVIVGDLIAISLLFFQMPREGYQMVNFVAAIGSIIVLVVGYVTFKRGNQSARLFLVAWGIFLGSVIIFVLKDYGILQYNQLTANAVQIGSALEALLLSFALGDKINTYRKEKELAQARELSISLENQQLVREQNIVLEQKVVERTYELTESNASLQSTLTHLKETQSQLIEAETMASLGQLTAGVAHDINNPINFVTANVAPLKRDINMVWDMVDEFERIALVENLSSSDKQQLIAKYREEMDTDYLRTEVDFLLKGLHDGAHRTAEIVKSLRIFSRVDEDTLKFADINEGLESTMVILNSLVKESITVEKIYGDIPKIECYAGKLNQVFLNILTNAVYAINKRFDLKTGGILRIETGIFEDSSCIYVKIEDNGTGMKQEVREKIFEPFFTTKEVGEGTGLGMSIAYNTIAKHHGKILVNSLVGEGTTFTLVLPIQQNI